ncbi:MAG TPA: LysM peptidoglycan-binding domain-containing protein [Planctomycetota bacterium]|nr:LysM peptidoglycan-binding domain-containing protein [Planctomycetota bacterium]
MGRLEKIVVLTVLFLVAVVLGVALTPTGDPGGREHKGGPVAGMDEGRGSLDVPKAPAPGLLTAEANVKPPTTAQGPAPEAKPSDAKPATTNAPGAIDPSKLAPTTPQSTTPPANPPAPVPAPTKYILTLEGLAPSAAPDMMFYTWKQGDSFAALAQHFYGSKEKVTRLQKANEGRTEASMKVDEVLWIPISETSKLVSTADTGKVYVVKSGDALSKISQEFYGTSKKWQKILDANRDILSSPEKLQPGMRLRIPE